MKALFALPLAMLSACATIVNGTSQSVTVSTTPPAATCTLDRVGARIGAVAQTPGSVRLDKSKNDLSVTCNKAGYQTATVVREPSLSGWTAGNIVFGLVGVGIGAVVDASSGANYEYPADIRLDMVADVPAPLPPIALQAAPAEFDAEPRVTPAAARYRPQQTRAAVAAIKGPGLY